MVTLAEMESLLDKKLGPIVSKLDSIKADYEALRTQQDELSEKVQVLTDELRWTKAKLEDQENRGRRNNLVFHGLPEQQGETWNTSEQIVLEHCSNELGITVEGAEVERAHRLNTKHHPRPIIIKFTSFKTKDRIIKRYREVRAATEGEPEHRISEDYAPGTRQARSKLWPTMKQALDNQERAIMKVDTLYIGDRVYKYDPVSDKVVMTVTTEEEQTGDGTGAGGDEGASARALPATPGKRAFSLLSPSQPDTQEPDGASGWTQAVADGRRQQQHNWNTRYSHVPHKRGAFYRPFQRAKGGQRTRR